MSINKEDDLKSKNSRKQTSFKIQFYIGIDPQRNVFWHFFTSPSPTNYDSVPDGVPVVDEGVAIVNVRSNIEEKRSQASLV